MKPTDGQRALRRSSRGVVKSPDNTGTRVQDGRTYFTSTCRTFAAASTRRYRDASLVARLLASCKNRARQLGVAFSLTAGDLVIPARCPVLGIPLQTEYAERTDNTPSVDRIDPRGDYVPTNVAVISWRANRLKSDATLEELAAVVAFYQRRSAP